MTLVAHLWQSTLCLGVAALLAIVLRQAPARVRHGIWIVASLKFLVPFSILVSAGRAAAAALGPDGLASGSVVVRWLDQPLSVLNLAAGKTASGLAGGLPPAFLAAAGLLWLAGSAALAAVRWRRWRAVARMAADGVQLEAGREVDAIARVAQRCRVTPRDIRVLRCEAPIEPSVLGFFRPVLIWPAGLSARLSDSELDAIVAHELCHVRRRDNLASLVQIVVETGFWFHPLVWWLSARLVAERERACDEEVVSMGAERRGYAEGILKVCGFCLRAPIACVAGVGGPRLSERVERIMTRPIEPLTGPMRVLVASVALLVVGAPLAAGVIDARHPAGGQSKAPPTALAQVLPVPIAIVEPHRASRPETRQTGPARRPLGAIARAPMSGVAAESVIAATSDQDKKIYRIRDGVTAPKLVYEVKPKYTDEAKEDKVQGSVVLDAVVLEDGTVGDVDVTRSLDDRLDQQAVIAMKEWRFEPGTKDGKAVAVRVEVEMTFTLR